MVWGEMSMLAILTTLRPELMRLGWLRLLVQWVDSEPTSSSLAERLRPYLSQCDNWNRTAGLVGVPAGGVAPSSLPRVPSGLVLYQLQDETSRRLTDLGHVLKLVDYTLIAENRNPFVWTTEQRFIGLRVVMGAAGDILLPFLKYLPSAARAYTNAESISLLSQELLRLKTQYPSQTEQITQILNRVGTQYATDRLLYPYIEPLRELGYLTLQSPDTRNRSYMLTERGRRLHTLLQDFSGSAQSWCETRIVRDYTHAEFAFARKRISGISQKLFEVCRTNFMPPTQRSPQKQPFYCIR